MSKTSYFVSRYVIAFFSLSPYSSLPPSRVYCSLRFSSWLFFSHCVTKRHAPLAQTPLNITLSTLTSSDPDSFPSPHAQRLRLSESNAKRKSSESSATPDIAFLTSCLSSRYLYSFTLSYLKSINGVASIEVIIVSKWLSRVAINLP